MLHRFHGISLLTYVWCESSLGEGRVDMFSRHFFADVCVSELSLGKGRVTTCFPDISLPTFYVFLYVCRAVF